MVALSGPTQSPRMQLSMDLAMGSVWSGAAPCSEIKPMTASEKSIEGVGRPLRAQSRLAAYPTKTSFWIRSRVH